MKERVNNVQGEESDILSRNFLQEVEADGFGGKTLW